MFNGGTLAPYDVDEARVRSADDDTDLDITNDEAREIVEEENGLWEVEVISQLQLSLNKMSTRLRTELACEKALPRLDDPSRPEGQNCLGDEDDKLGITVPSLIPGLPIDLAESCLARVPWVCHPKLVSVCKAWAAYLISDRVFFVRSQQGVSESLLLLLSVPLRLGPLRLAVFDAKAATKLKWHKPLAVFDYLGRWSGFLRGFRCAVVGPDLFIIGGRHDSLHYATGKNVWRFNFITRKWTEAAPMHAARRDFSCAVIDEKIYVAGGTDSNSVLPQGHGARSALKSAEMYDYAHDCWHRLPDMETERVGCLGVAVEGRFYAIGGGTDNGTVEFELYRSAEVLDTSEETPQWKTIDEMWQSRMKLPRAVAGYDDSLFAVDSKDQTLKSYDEMTNEWNEVMEMPSSSAIVPGRTGQAERQQAMGGVPGDQLVDFPREGLFWIGPCARVSHVHDYHLLRLHEGGENARGGWSGNAAGTLDSDGESACTSARQATVAHHGQLGFKLLGKNSSLVIGSGIVHI